MDKPRRRAAGRPAGPPNVVAAPSTTDPPSAARSEEPAAPAVPTAPPPPRDALREQKEQAGQQHRRRQRPARQAIGETVPTARGEREAAPRDPEPPRAQQPRQPPAQPSGRDDRRRGESPVERSLRALVSTRTTQLPPTVAMRAREVAAPTRADLAAAEQDLVIVRRYYVPPAPLATAGKPADQRAPEKRAAESRGRTPEGRRGGRRPQQG